MDSGSVLLVDDDDLICISLGRGLERQGFAVTTAANGKSAISALESRSFDFVVSDLLMEGSDGLGVLRRSKELRPEASVIILTGFADLASATEALRLGADDYVSKPCDAWQLSERIRWCAEKRRPVAELRSALAGREVLLRETHHRVKNDFLMVSALVGLQLSFIDYEADRIRLEELRTKIQTIALVHEELFLGRDYERIGLRRYLTELCRRTLRGFNPRKLPVSLHAEIEDESLPTEAAIPVGLIVTELLTNTMKHAFTSMESGHVDVTLRRRTDGFLLTVRDNGAGLESEGVIGESNTLGMKIVSGLTSQLRGVIRYRFDGGATFEVSFPAEEG